MSEKSISMCQGKGSLSHNNREFTAKNIDSSRTADNIIFVHQDLGNAYDYLFSNAVERYNARQKRNDRKIPDYFQHLFNREPNKSVITGTNKQKSFYEDLVQIGTKDNTGVGTPDAEIAVVCLSEYMEGFQQRNPNFHVFNAVLHMDEATPHLHIDYIPVGHFDRGLENRNAMAKALEEMGYGKGANAINRWRLAEWEVLHKICTAHGIEISEPKKSRGYSFTVQEYGEHKDEIRRLEEEKAQVCAELDKATKKKVRLTEIDSIEIKKSRFSKKISVSEEDFENLTNLAKKQVTNVKNNKKLKSENAELAQKITELEVQIKSLTAELDEYRQPATFSREQLKKSAKKISELEQLKSKYHKALEFINSFALTTEFEKFQHITIKSKQLE